MRPPGPIGPASHASGQVVIAVVPPRVVEEIRPGAEAVAVDHPSWGLRGTRDPLHASPWRVTAPSHRRLTTQHVKVPGSGSVSGLGRKPPPDLSVEAPRRTE